MLHILKHISKLERCPHMYTVLMSIDKKIFHYSIVGTSCSGRATLSGVSPVADLER